MRDIQLTENFRLSELVKSQTAERLNIDNWPKDQQTIDNLQTLCKEIVQPIRTAFDLPIIPNSGYRCLELNRSIGSKDTSQHTKGQAIDFEVPGISNLALAEFIRDNFNYDQLILEFWYEEEPMSGWVHVSYVDPIQNRNQHITINRNGTFKGFRSI